VRTTLPSVTLYDNTTTASVDTRGYDGDGNVVFSTDGAGDRTTSSYDPLERQVATTNPVSGTTLTTYNATERTATQDAVGNISHDAYDGAGRLTLASDPLTGTVGYGYDAVGNTTAITSGDNMGHTTQLETRGYDARNEAITDTVGGPGSSNLTTLTAYDLDGNVKQTEQPQGDTTDNTYDLADQLNTQLIYPHPVTTPGANDAVYSGYSYDQAGNVTVSIDADGRSTTTTLDGANRTGQESSVTADRTTVITTTNSFDPDGNTVSWTRKTQSPTGPVQTQTDSATFDATDRQISTTDNGLATSYGYDAAGRQRTHTIIDGTTPVTTTLDSEGRATALSEGMGGSGPYTGTWGYNLNDLPVTMSVPGGVQGARGYDPSSRLTSLTLTGPASSPATTTLTSTYGYGYNAVNWTTNTTTLAGTDTLVHDAQGRLTSETGPQVVATGGAYRWTYDPNGNLTSQIGDDGFPVTYTYTSTTPNEVQTMVMGKGQPTASYSYDVHGDTTAITDGVKINKHLTYDSRERPVQVTFLDTTTSATGSVTTIPATVTLAYNPSGLRAEYAFAEQGKTTLDEKFTYRNGVLGQMQLVQGSLAYADTYLYTEAGAPYELLRQQGGATSRYWYEVDGRGNVVALTDSNGKVVDRYAYDSWGELTSNDGIDESVPQQLRYAGYWYDEKLSWYWLRVRYYDPEIARFLAPDPSQQDGVRTYAYVSDNPIDSKDPTGRDGICSLDGIDLICFVGEVVGGVVAGAVALARAVGAAAFAVGALASVIYAGANAFLHQLQNHQAIAHGPVAWSPEGVTEIEYDGHTYLLGAYRALGKLAQAVRRGFQIHHIIQTAACESLDRQCKIPNYNYYIAPAVLLLSGGSGSDHAQATNIQQTSGRGVQTYEGEREIGFRALVAARIPPVFAAFLIVYADTYFMGQLHLTFHSPMCLVPNRV